MLSLKEKNGVHESFFDSSPVLLSFRDDVIHLSFIFKFCCSIKDDDVFLLNFVVVHFEFNCTWFQNVISIRVDVVQG